MRTCRVLAPEDIRPGKYIAVMHEIGEYLPLVCAGDQDWRRVELLRVLWLPQDESVPLRVSQVCLPFVLVEQPDGKCCTFDTRRYRVAKVPRKYAQNVWRRLRKRTPPGGGTPFQA